MPKNVGFLVTYAIPTLRRGLFCMRPGLLSRDPFAQSSHTPRHLNYFRTFGSAPWSGRLPLL